MTDVERVLLRLERSMGLRIATAPVPVPGRIGEHRAGLRAARLAFNRADAEGARVLGHHADGRPQWPDEWTGSIAHSDGLAIAAVAPLATHRAVGVDLERAGALELDDARLVLNESEVTWAQETSDTAGPATLLWSVKESAFKAWSTASGGLADVDPIEIHVEVDGRHLRAIATGRLLTAPFTEPLSGEFAIVGGRLVTALVNRHPMST